MKSAVLLITIGTPKSYSVPDVRKYLSHFLNDPYVINIPWLWRKILVNLIIVPFRAPKSATKYQQIWTEDGFPLYVYLKKVRDQLANRMGSDADVWFAMSYASPSIEEVLKRMENEAYEQVTVVPLFPNYANSTTGSIYNSVNKAIKLWRREPQLNFIKSYYDHPLFLDAWVDRIKDYNPDGYDHILFSFHGLPLSHLPSKTQINGIKVKEVPNYDDYEKVCYHFTYLIAERLGLKEKQYSLAFQSRMSKRWLRPFTDERLVALAEQKQKVLVVALSFVADCLETTLELGEEYKEIFFAHGGEEYQLVDSLNDNSKWLDALENIVMENSSL